MLTFILSFEDMCYSMRTPRRVSDRDHAIVEDLHWEAHAIEEVIQAQRYRFFESTRRQLDRSVVHRLFVDVVREPFVHSVQNLIRGVRERRPLPIVEIRVIVPLHLLVSLRLLPRVFPRRGALYLAENRRFLLELVQKHETIMTAQVALEFVFHDRSRAHAHDSLDDPSELERLVFLKPRRPFLLERMLDGITLIREAHQLLEPLILSL
mmetsp:Transcript_15694/g.63211  ORF Transcript_15694/g.63211 Transcript_15694/m.63211 type:complete len:209 (-) Transcript_15694:126-752(-)